MAAITHIPPEILKQVLVMDGWKVTHEDAYNWLLEKSGKDPLPIPKRVRMLPFEIHEHCLQVAELEFGRYLELLQQTGYKH